MNRRDVLRAGLVAAMTMKSGAFARLAHASPASIFELKFPTPEGDTLAVSSFLGKPMVLNFWATWCPPCVKEMPDLDFLHHKYPDISIVGLGVDTASNIDKFSEKVSVSYPLLIAGHGGIQLMKEMGNPKGGLPFTILFDAQGQPVRHFLGQIQRDDLDAILADVTRV